MRYIPRFVHAGNGFREFRWLGRSDRIFARDLHTAVVTLVVSRAVKSPLFTRPRGRG